MTTWRKDATGFTVPIIPNPQHHTNYRYAKAGLGAARQPDGPKLVFRGNDILVRRPQLAGTRPADAIGAESTQNQINRLCIGTGRI